MQLFKKILLYTVLSSILLLYYLSVATNNSVHSDAGSVLLMSKSILEGNVFLNGWFLSTGSYYSTELIWYSLFIVLFGFNSNLIYLVSSIFFLILSWLVFFVSGRTREGFSYRRAIVGFLLIGLPSPFVSTLVFSGAMHISALCYVLIALIALEFIKRNYLKYSIYFVLLTLVLFADPFMIWTFFVPFIITSFLIWIVKKEMKEPITITVSVLSYIFSKILLYLFNFNIPETSTAFVELEKIKGNIFLYIKGMLEIYNANIFGKSVGNYNTVIVGLHIIVLFCIVMILFNAIKKIKNSREFDKLYLFLLVGIVINVAEFIFSNLAVDINSARYLFPSIVYASIFVAKYSKIPVSFTKHATLLYYPIIIVYILISLNYPIGFEKVKQDEVIQFLESKNLKTGYGSYWNSHNLTVQSKGVISIYPIIASESGISSFNWLSNINWYNNEANFVIFQNDNWGNINQATVATGLGEPDQIYQFNSYTIMVWENSIQSRIIKSN
ncbi:hypothetical protein D3C74_176010 [compost metagenome]